MPVWKGRIDYDADPGIGAWRMFGCAMCVVFSMAVQTAAADAYLDMVNREAMNVDRVESVAGNGNLDAFELLLKTKYRGSYLFHKKLSKRSQEEIFIDYQNGASISDIRKKIMNIFLHKE